MLPENQLKTINIIEKLGKKLLLIEQPARYTAGEYRYGEEKSLGPESCTVGLCFPDLYEIGMSNNAIRILYNLIQNIDGVVCDHVFSVAPDFEELLRTEELPLPTLYHGIPLKDLDVLGFSIGYELSATNILQVLDLGGIPLHSEDRGESDPIIIAGGPAITNPLPFSPFLDFVFVGEAENGLAEVIACVRDMKQNGEKRSDIIEKLKQDFQFLWCTGKNRAYRTIDDTFAEGEHALFDHYVLPAFRVAQDHGVVEIMRGCPNGCRFCHAGQFYKPFRQKDLKTIYRETRQQVEDFGYREVTLSSLSSGDHPQLSSMIESLNEDFSPHHISFSLPSLKVSTFNLSVLEKLNEVRKSGLTFAIETPMSEWQKSINKEVPFESVISIIREAKSRGWKLAKFYFMVGIPFTDFEKEGEAIVEFLKEVKEKTRIGMNINIGTFIPKPHTAYQWAAQMNMDVSRAHLQIIKRTISEEIKGAKVSYHDPVTSYIEGIVSRGDIHVSRMIEYAYQHGCRLDAWQEHFKRQVWLDAIDSCQIDVSSILYTPYDLEGPLPWDSVSLRVSKAFLKQEWYRAESGDMTPVCLEDCASPCGSCTSDHAIVPAAEHSDNLVAEERIPSPVNLGESLSSVVFIYEKKGKAVYLSHISAMRAMEQTFQRAGVPVAFTEGYNPKPRMEFVHPLATGVSGSEEVLGILARGAGSLNEEETLKSLNRFSPEGFNFKRMLVMSEGKRTTLSKFHTGGMYSIDSITDETYAEKLREMARACSKDITVSRLVLGGNEQFSVYIKGQKNPVKALFPEAEDKFKVLSAMNIHRDYLITGEEDGVLFTYEKILS